MLFIEAMVGDNNVIHVGVRRVTIWVGRSGWSGPDGCYSGGCQLAGRAFFGIVGRVVFCLRETEKIREVCNGQKI